MAARIVAGLSGLLWLYCTVFNIVVYARLLLLKITRPSPMPFLGAIALYFAWAVCPRDEWRPWFALGLLIDPGTSVSAYHAVLESWRNRKRPPAS